MSVLQTTGSVLGQNTKLGFDVCLLPGLVSYLYEASLFPSPHLLSGCMLSNQVIAHLSCGIFAVMLQTGRSLTALQEWTYFFKILNHRVLHFPTLHKQILCKNRQIWNKTFKSSSNNEKKKKKGGGKERGRRRRRRRRK